MNELPGMQRGSTLLPWTVGFFRINWYLVLKWILLSPLLRWRGARSGRGSEHMTAHPVTCPKAIPSEPPKKLVERGLEPARARLFVIHSADALRKAVCKVFGKACRVQSCRNHKMRNMLGHLPKTLHDQAQAVLRAAWKLNEKDGKARIEQFASWVDREHPAAAGSLREGLGELFTVNELGLTPPLRRCLGTTNLIDNAHSGMRQRMRRVTRWRDGSMVVRWAAASFLDAGQNYRKIMGYRDLWILVGFDDPFDTVKSLAAGWPVAMVLIVGLPDEITVSNSRIRSTQLV